MVRSFVRLAGGPLGLAVTVAELLILAVRVADALGSDGDDDKDEKDPVWG